MSVSHQPSDPELSGRGAPVSLAELAQPRDGSSAAVRPIRVAQLTASRSLGGKERQIIELSATLPSTYESLLVAFHEDGHASAVLEAAQLRGLPGVALAHDIPQVLPTLRELVRVLRDWDADILCCHGYKAKILGTLAGRWLGRTVVAVSHGWTGESWKVRLYERLSRWSLAGADHVVCVSEAQAQRVLRRAPVRRRNVSAIPDAVQVDRFDRADDAVRRELENYFTSPPRHLIGAAGRLSPEKGFSVLVEAAARICGQRDDVGFLLCGDGPLRQSLEEQVAALGLEGRFCLAGHRKDLDRWLPHWDLLVLPSYTEGLPNVVLEAFAACVPVVATAVGGTPELIEDGVSGYLVPPGKPLALAERIEMALACADRRRAMGLEGHDRVSRQFTFELQAAQYDELFQRLLASRRKTGAAAPRGRR